MLEGEKNEVNIKKKICPVKSVLIPKKPIPKRSTRITKKELEKEFSMLSENTLYNIDPVETNELKTDDPKTVKEAMERNDWQEWKKAMIAEMNSMGKTKTFQKLKRKNLPIGRKPIGCKWVFKLKKDENGNVTKYKARIVAKGYSQKFGTDYEHTFAPTVKISAVRILLTIAAKYDLELKHLDISTAYLHGDLEEDIYMEQPEWFEEVDRSIVYKLMKSLYGLKQAGRQWNKKIHSSLLEAEFVQCPQEPCVYMREKNGKKIVIAIFVDDIIIAASENNDIEEVKNFLSIFYELNDEGELSWYTGIKIVRNRQKREIYLYQPQYTENLLKNFNMQDCNPVKTPLTVNDDNKLYIRSQKDDEWLKTKMPYREAIGSIMFLMLMTRPDLAYAVGVASRYLDNHSQYAWNAVKRILRYIKGTKNFGIILGASEGNNSEAKELKLTCYADADWAGDTNDRKSTSGYVNLLGNSLVSWKSEKQPTVAQSTTEAELIAANSGVREVVAIRRILRFLGLEQKEPTIVYEDNQGCISLMHNDVKNKRTKHIEIKYFWIREKIEDGVIKLLHCSSEKMLADMMTKQVASPVFEKLRSELKIVDIEEIVSKLALSINQK